MNPRPKKTAVLVAQRIVADINKRGNKVGDRLPTERSMLEEYKVGRGTLRESLRFLEIQGVLTFKAGPGGGPVVQHPDGSSLASSLTLLLQFDNAPFRAIAEARVGLEPVIADLAAQRIDDVQLADLKSSLDTMQENLDYSGIFLEENRRFHNIIAHSSGNALYSHLIDSLLGLLDGSAIGIDYPEVRRPAIHRAHALIYDAIASRDPMGASEAMAAHIHEYMIYAERRFPHVLAAPIVWNN